MTSFARARPILAAAAVAGAAALGLSSLPPAPILPAAEPAASSTTSGALRASMERLAYAGGSLWATVPAPPYWELERHASSTAAWENVTPVGESTRGGIVASVLGANAAAVAYRAYGGNSRSAFAITADGGSTWSTGLLPGPVALSGAPMAASGPRTLWAVVARRRANVAVGPTPATLERSNDGGDSWKPVAMPAAGPGPCYVQEVRFVDALDGWASGTCGPRASLWLTADGGSSWEAQMLPKVLASATSSTVAAPAQSPAAGGGAWSWVATRRGKATALVVLHRSVAGRWTASSALEVPGPLVIGASPQGEVWAATGSSAGFARSAPALYHSTPSGGWGRLAAPAGLETVYALTQAPNGLVILLGRDRSAGGSQGATVIWSGSGSMARPSWSRTPLPVAKNA